MILCFLIVFLFAPVNFDAHPCKKQGLYTQQLKNCTIVRSVRKLEVCGYNFAAMSARLRLVFAFYLEGGDIFV